MISTLLIVILTYVFFRLRFLMADGVYSIIPGWHTTILPPAMTWTLLVTITLIGAILLYVILQYMIKLVKSVYERVCKS